MRRILAMAGFALAMLAALTVPAFTAEATTAPAPAAVETQRTIFNHTGVARKDAYMWPTLNQPVNYLMPANYRDGAAYLRVVVSGKPSTKPLWLHICAWRHGTVKWQYETCSSGTQATFSTNGTYYFALSGMGTWWRKNGVWDYTKQASDIRPLLKDPVTGKLMYTASCATTCYRLPDIDKHIPFNMQIEFIVVGKGSTLNPPTAWRGHCPKTWSALC